MSMTADDIREDRWEAEQQSYKAAVGSVAFAAAELENALHEALVMCFPERVEQADLLLGNLSMAELTKAFGTFFAYNPANSQLCHDIVTLSRKRNDIMHGVVVQYGIGGEARLVNRRRPRQVVAKPTLQILRDLAAKLETAALAVKIEAARWPHDDKPNAPLRQRADRVP